MHVMSECSTRFDKNVPTSKPSTYIFTAFVAIRCSRSIKKKTIVKVSENTLENYPHQSITYLCSQFKIWNQLLHLYYVYCILFIIINYYFVLSILPPIRRQFQVCMCLWIAIGRFKHNHNFDLRKVMEPITFQPRFYCPKPTMNYFPTFWNFFLTFFPISFIKYDNINNLLINPATCPISQ